VFLKYIDFIFEPFRKIRTKWWGVKNIKGNIAQDVSRSKAMVGQGKQMVGQVQGYNQQVNQYAQGGQQMQQGMPQGGAPGAPGAPGGPNPNPPITTKGFWLWKKKFCTQCGQQLDSSWDACPYCAQIAVQVVQAPIKQALKTQAFVMDAAGGGPSGMQLLGWIVPLQGPQRGELFTLSPNTTIGTDPKCTVVLNDKFMSSKHAEIKAENGVWVLKDVGSTNGTYVNNRRVDRHELVDNDFIKFGSALLKFKSL
jgi:FHA domain-containing protein